MEPRAVETSYARWAPVYDRTFGAITRAGRLRAIETINEGPGKVLEVGVGTGLALPLYDPGARVTGIDYSHDMLAKAMRRTERESLRHVEALVQMDARDLAFPDAHFDTVAAMHVLSVVPEPERVMAEIARVCKPGGRVIVTNHFQRSKGFLALIERMSARFENVLGWHSDFPIEKVLGERSLKVTRTEPLPPLGMMTLLVLEKVAAEN